MTERVPSQNEISELAFLRGVHRRLPEHVSVLKALAELCTETGFFEEGLVLDEKLSRLCQDDADIWYNLACSQALAKQPAEALLSLEKAVLKGYAEADWMLKDRDLQSLHNEQRFHELTDVARRNVHASGVVSDAG